MATTDTRSGFRLPWSSDRSQDSDPEGSAESTPATDSHTAEGIAWPSSDFNDRAVAGADPASAGSPAEATQHEVQEPEMVDSAPASVAPPVPKKPSKLMADLSAAIRATAEAARDQALAQVDADVASVVEQIRTGAKDGEDALRVHADEDIAGIKEWSRSEIARIKQETDHKIESRKLGLDEELAAHAAAIEHRVGEVEGAASAYRTEMESYASSLGEEDDPARLATMAESMPEAPALEALADLADLKLDLATEAPVEGDASEASVEAVTEAEPAEVEAVGGAAELEAVGEPAEVEAVAEPTEAVAEPDGEPAEVEAVAEPDGEATADAANQPAADADGGGRPGSAWADADGAWGAPPTTGAATEPAAALTTAVAEAEPQALADDGSSEWTSSADGPRWADGEVPEGFPAGEQGGDPVDRGAIMAALEAAAEAVVAAESAADSADQAEVAAGVAETAAELIKGKKAPGEELDPEAAAAMSARVDAGGFEESYADRLASLMPGHGDASGDNESRTTRVIVSGLVSVASIASFKRHLGRLTGVEAVAVASGPDGEFVFNVTHRPDVSFRDAVPTMPGFAARVTGSGDGTVTVTARDPEAEG